LSLLSTVGHADWATETSEAYIEKAAELANNRELRQSLRNTLREDLTKSTLCDHAAQTTRFEAALRMAWGEWCASQS
jgi:predicted O-linked N-acetylglucosamine transferase (SPINDLY family)